MKLMEWLAYPRMLRMIVKALPNNAAIKTDESGKLYLSLQLHGFEQRVDWNNKQRRNVRLGEYCELENIKDCYTPLSINYRTSPQAEPTYLVFRHATNFIEWYDTVTTGCPILARDIREKRRPRP